MVKLPIGYPDKPMTPFGGMALMKRYMEQPGISASLAGLEYLKEQLGTRL